MSPADRFEVRALPGRVPYPRALALQRELVERRKAGAIGDTLILLEHASVITLGRNADAAGVVASEALLRRRGIQVHRAERGGQATYHGPGQVVGYPIVDLHGLGLGVAAYVRRLEETMVRAAGRLGVEAGRREGLTGVFAEPGKIGAVGVRVTRGVTYHGFALNADPELEHYRLIVPCGLLDTPVTSLAAILGRPLPFAEAREAVAAAFAEVFGVELVPTRG